MPDTALIDPTRDRVWAVDVNITFTTYVIAETARKAEQVAEHEEGDPHYSARELTVPLASYDPDAGTTPYGHSCWQDRELTVNEAVELVAGHKPAYDTETVLMPFAEGPPPLYPPRIEDYLAAGRCAR
jgi:hypothetical protein